MTVRLSRRQFLGATAAATAVAAVPRPIQAAAAPARGFSFVLLGDLHFDRPAHHDMDWVRKDKPNDIGQIENYCRITRDLSPRLFATVREVVAAADPATAARIAFVLQAGDLVEGLCGSEELSVRQNTEAVGFITEARLGAPLVFTKGNHDITGPGAGAAFDRVFLPFLAEQARAIGTASAMAGARFTVERGNAQFVFFDAYEAAKSLEWFEAVAARRTAEHLFVIVHPPVVPYGARATWHIYSSDRERARREKFLGLLGRHRALVLGGHIHKYNTLAREAGGGRFAQFALSSVISAPVEKAKHELSGVGDYNGDQIRVEPQFSPDTESARRAVYAAERPFIRDFAYADLPGYAVVTVDGPRVVANMFAGVSRTLWRTVDLKSLAQG